MPRRLFREHSGDTPWYTDCTHMAVLETVVAPRAVITDGVLGPRGHRWITSTRLCILTRPSTDHNGGRPYSVHIVPLGCEQPCPWPNCRRVLLDFCLLPESLSSDLSWEGWQGAGCPVRTKGTGSRVNQRLLRTASLRGKGSQFWGQEVHGQGGSW